MELENNIKPREKGAKIRSILCSAKKRKKSCRLSEVEVAGRDEWLLPALLPSAVTFVDHRHRLSAGV